VAPKAVGEIQTETHSASKRAERMSPEELRQSECSFVGSSTEEAIRGEELSLSCSKNFLGPRSVIHGDFVPFCAV